MQIFVTEEIASSADLPLVDEDRELNPLFSWTAGWYREWGDCGSGEDTLIAFNNAARFVVAIYPVSREDLPEVLGGFKDAIRHALEAEHSNPALIESYLSDLGEIHYVRDSSKGSTERLDYSERALWEYFPYESILQKGVKSDLLGRNVNVTIENDVSLYGVTKTNQPAQSLGDALSGRYGLPRYQFNAIAIECSLDLIRYKAVRKIVVPSDQPLILLSDLIQHLYGWANDYSHRFVSDEDTEWSGDTYVSSEDADPTTWDECTFPEEDYTVSDLFGEDLSNHSLYEYDSEYDLPWKIDLILTKRLETYDKELPRQLSAVGQAPPEECGNVENFLEMLENMDHPDSTGYKEAKEKLGNWNPELPENLQGEQVITND